MRSRECSRVNSAASSLSSTARGNTNSSSTSGNGRTAAVLRPSMRRPSRCVRPVIEAAQTLRFEPSNHHESPTHESGVAFTSTGAAASGSPAPYTWATEGVAGSPTHLDQPPSVLIITQNVGGLEAGDGEVASSTCNRTARTGILRIGSPPVESSSSHSTGSPITNNFASTLDTLRRMGGRGDPASPSSPSHGAPYSEASSAPMSGQMATDALDSTINTLVDAGDCDLSQSVRENVLEFIADLRCWIHSVSHTHAQRQHAAAALARDTASGETAPCDPSSLAEQQYPHSGPSRRADGPEELAFLGLEEDATDSCPPLIDVVVLHLQEIGGKHRNLAFNQNLATELSISLLPEAGWCSGLLMEEDFSGASDPNEDHLERFTAIGTIIFVSRRICPVTSMYCFGHRVFVPVMDDPLDYVGGNLRHLYHGGKFSNAGRSRKGYLLTSLQVGHVPLNFCNVHLFNDEDNVEALGASPSKYVARRQTAAMEAMAECLTLFKREEPMFVSGDLNVRLDGNAVAEELHRTLGAELRPERKKLRCPDSVWAYLRSPANHRSLQQRFDREPAQLMKMVEEQLGLSLAEFSIDFAPTYLRRVAEVTTRHTIDGSLAALVADASRDFAHERLPAWCDRIWFNAPALEAIHSTSGRRRQRGGGGAFVPHPEDPSSACLTSSGVQTTCSTISQTHSRMSSLRTPPTSPFTSSVHRAVTATSTAMELQESLGGGRAGEAEACIDYGATTLIHTDHDGVFLLF